MIEDVSMMNLRKRMYYFVIYQLMGIQKGINVIMLVKYMV